MVLCPVVAAEQAAQAQHPLRDELELLCTHGILHLLGYDHAEADERTAMFGLQDRCSRPGAPPVMSHPAGARTRKGRKGRGEATMVWLIIAAAVLALGAGLCASAEVALMRVSRSGAGELARSRKGNRNRAATRLQAVLAEPARYLAVLLLARVCSETAAIVLVAAALLHWLGTGWHVFLLIFVIMAAVLYVLAGIGPRILGRQHERTVALMAADVLYPVTRVLGPLPGCCWPWAAC